MASDKGLIVFIYKDRGHSCSNGGLSSAHDKAILTGIDCEVFNVSEEYPGVKLVYRNLGRSQGQYVHAEPIEQPEGKRGPMFGGCFIYASDGRFPTDYPIPLHDRWE
jgi:hypothetical protein